MHLTIIPIVGMPLIKQGDDLATLVFESISRQKEELKQGDVIVVAQKIVSKSEGQTVMLDSITPSTAAIDLAKEVEKDPRLVELVLKESTAVVRKAPGILIVRHRIGIIGSNAGIDQSNIDHSNGECALLLPKDPDLSALHLRNALTTKSDVKPGVIISDSMNRPWRLGSIGCAIGSAGVMVLDDRRGDTDIFGREMKMTMTNQADSIATSAMLVIGETTEQVPVAIVRGLSIEQSSQTAKDAIRPSEDDIFL